MASFADNAINENPMAIYTRDFISNFLVATSYTSSAARSATLGSSGGTSLSL